MDPLTVLIADDHPLFRSGLRALLASMPEVSLVGEATNGAEAVQMAEALQPDLLLSLERDVVASVGEALVLDDASDAGDRVDVGRHRIEVLRMAGSRVARVRIEDVPSPVERGATEGPR